MDEASREMAKVRNQEFVFFGKVVDFEGAPVVDAKLRMDVRIFGARPPQKPFKVYNAITDGAGLFSITGFGEMITLEYITGYGYKYHYKYNRERTRQLTQKEQSKGPGFKPDKPMVFRIRKKAPASFVFSSGWDFSLRDGKLKWLDLYRQQWTNPKWLGGTRLNYPDWHADVKVSVEEDGEKFRLILETLDPDSGFVIETPEFFEEMTEAPEQGYRSKLIIPIAKKSGGQLFAYVKSAGGLFFSKLSVSYSSPEGRDYVGLRFGYWTNVTGGRGLGSDDRLFRQYIIDEREGRRGQVLREQLLNGETVAPMIQEEQ
jgi:hypothetical protein